MKTISRISDPSLRDDMVSLRSVWGISLPIGDENNRTLAVCGPIIPTPHEALAVLHDPVLAASTIRHRDMIWDHDEQTRDRMINAAAVRVMAINAIAK
jgi:hypothetical protein